MSNETALDVMRDKIADRVQISAALIKRMGITAEVYETDRLERDAARAGAGALHAGFDG